MGANVSANPIINIQEIGRPRPTPNPGVVLLVRMGHQPELEEPR